MGADVGSSVSGVIPYTARDHEDTRTNTAVFKTRRATAPGLKSQVPSSYGVNQAIGGYLNFRTGNQHPTTWHSRARSCTPMEAATLTPQQNPETAHPWTPGHHLSSGLDLSARALRLCR